MDFVGHEGSRGGHYSVQGAQYAGGVDVGGSEEQCPHFDDYESGHVEKRKYIYDVL
jgi:hypothetical protein